MKINPTEALKAITDLDQKWQAVCPNQSFFGFTLEQYRARVKPSLDSRATLARLDGETKVELERRHTGDEDSLYVVNCIINAIKGDPTQGEDGELYGALGYVRKSKRAKSRAGARMKEAAAVEAKRENAATSGSSAEKSEPATAESEVAA